MPSPRYLKVRNSTARRAGIAAWAAAKALQHGVRTRCETRRHTPVTVRADPAWPRRFFHAPSGVPRIGSAAVGRGVFVRCAACRHNKHCRSDVALEAFMCAAGVAGRDVGRRGAATASVYHLLLDCGQLAMVETRTALSASLPR